MKPYNEYKYTGLDWLPRVPTHWEIKKIQSFAKPKSVRNRAEAQLLSVYRDYGVIPKNSRDDNHNAASEDLTNYKFVEVGDLVLNKMKTWQGSLAISSHEGIVSPAYIVCRVHEDWNRSFLHLLLRTRIYIGVYNAISYGVRIGQWDMRWEDFKLIPVVSPPLEEQKVIVNYLAAKNREIESYIAAKRSLLARLKELSVAVVSRAVTQGLNSDVKTKPSGLSWLDNVPEHWGIKKLRWCASLKSGDSITSENIEDEGEFPVYGGNGLRGYTSSFTHDGHFALIGRQGALCGNINYASGKFYASEHAVVVTPNPSIPVHTLYLGELLRAMNLNQYSMTAAQPGLSVETIGRLKIPLPPIQEQEAIVAYIETKLATIQEAKFRIEREIELARELWTTLVAEVVTGQIDVSDWVGVEETLELSSIAGSIEAEYSDLEDEDSLIELNYSEVGNEV